ncbi:MAG: pentapeptide repeat-containing protein [Clostridiales bacterium]|nr:pentapeptide repeat-containing protein [Clostridiales bacterium]
MNKQDILEDMGRLVVVDQMSEFIALAEALKNEGGTIEEKYITALTGEKLDFSSIEGTGIIVENCTFNRVVFQKSYFKDCLFKNCDFSNCDFSSSTFSNCLFQNIKGVGADFSESVLKDMEIKECLFRYGVFTYSLLKDCNIADSDFSESFIDNCKIKKLNLDKVNLIRTNLCKTPLKGIDLRSAQIDGIILSAEAKELYGAVVELSQAAELAKILGIIIK